jgi:hypothetical protein
MKFNNNKILSKKVKQILKYNFFVFNLNYFLSNLLNSIFFKLISFCSAFLYLYFFFYYFLYKNRNNYYNNEI